jgi:hypothetical protein
MIGGAGESRGLLVWNRVAAGGDCFALRDLDGGQGTRERARAEQHQPFARAASVAGRLRQKFSVAGTTLIQWRTERGVDAASPCEREGVSFSSSGHSNSTLKRHECRAPVPKVSLRVRAFWKPSECFAPPTFGSLG